MKTLRVTETWACDGKGCRKVEGRRAEMGPSIPPMGWLMVHFLSTRISETRTFCPSCAKDWEPE